MSGDNEEVEGSLSSKRMHTNRKASRLLRMDREADRYHPVWTWWRNLYFQNDVLEKSFVEFDMKNVLKQNKIGIVLGLVLTIIFSAGDAFTPSPVFLYIMMLRSFMIVVVSMIIVVLFVPRLQRWSNWTVVLIFCGVGFANGLLLFVSGSASRPLLGHAMVIQGVLYLLIYPFTRLGIFSLVFIAFVMIVNLFLAKVGFARTVYQILQLLSLWIPCMVSVYYKQLFRRRTYLAMHLLTEETAFLHQTQKKDEELLCNFLPLPIVRRLREGADVTEMVDRHSHVSILFCDLSDFMEKEGNIQEIDMHMAVLDEVFSQFDALLKDTKVNKIKTDGCVYMASCGCPEPEAAHASLMVRFAKDILGVVDGYNKMHGFDLAPRIGIHSGAVVSGVVGTGHFFFDVWGATVKIARRMTETALPGRIHISHDTRWNLNDSSIEVLDRGSVQIKGEPIRTYLVQMGDDSSDSESPVKRISDQTLLEYLENDDQDFLDATSSDIQLDLEETIMHCSYVYDEEQTHRLLKTKEMNWITLRFGDPMMETRYHESHRGPLTLEMYRTLLLVAAVTMVIFEMSEIVYALCCHTAITALMLPHFILGVLVPLGVYVASFMPNAPPELMSSLLVVGCLVSSSFVRILLRVDPEMVNAVAHLSITIVYTGCNIRVRVFQTGPIILLSPILFYVTLLLSAREVPSRVLEELPNAFVMAIMSSVNLWHAEKQRRQDFMLRDRAMEQRRQAKEIALRIINLIRSILPDVAAASLRDNAKTLSTRFTESAVLTCEIVDVDDLVDERPGDVVAFVVQLYSAFDQLLDVHDCEKIRNNGTTYVVGAGIHTPAEGGTMRLCHMALQMVNCVIQANSQFGEDVKVRVAVHAGPLVAGVVGRRNFVWDAWGKTVRYCARLASKDNQVVASSTVYPLVKDKLVVEQCEDFEGSPTHKILGFRPSDWPPHGKSSLSRSRSSLDLSRTRSTMTDRPAGPAASPACYSSVPHRQGHSVLHRGHPMS